MTSQMSVFDLQSGIHGRDAGIAAVISSNQCFTETMRGIARIICRNKGTVSSDDLREIAREENIHPASPNAWGAIFKGSEWVFVSRKKSKLPSNHARVVCVWKLKNG